MMEQVAAGSSGLTPSEEDTATDGTADIPVLNLQMVEAAASPRESQEERERKLLKVSRKIGEGEHCSVLFVVESSSKS